MRVLCQPLCLSRQARRIRQVGGWSGMVFLNPSWTVPGAAWWASTPALPLGRQQLGEGLAKSIHIPHPCMHVKRGRNCLALVCPGFVHRQPTVGLSHCVNSLLWGLTAQHHDWVFSPWCVPQEVPEAWCEEQCRAACAAGGRPGCGLQVERTTQFAEKNCLKMSCLHLVSVPNTALYFILYKDGGVDLQKCYHLLIQTVVLGARNGGRAKFFAAWGLCCWLTAPAEINAQNIVGQVRPWCTSSVLLLFHKAWI